ncbi:MAG TPA: putative lipid II flippase FtsW [Planctomycetota bacterium]|nr:putative lipid II flippase FtsW [Planctomycetota bacterium]
MDNARRTLLLVVGTLLAMGMVMVYSASFVVAEKKFGSPTYFLQRHAIYLIAGCMALAVASLFDYHKLTRHWKWFFGICVVLLIAVLIPGIGSKFNGARRWFSFGGLTFQPSEAVKPLMILAMAGWLVHARDRIGTFKHGFLPGVAMAGTIVVLTALEPDLGSAALLLAVLGSMLFVGGVKLRYALPVIVCALPIAALLAYKKLGYIERRVSDWWVSVTQGISADPLGSGYQNTQALMAQGSGGVWGTGLGQGHAKLLYLPEAHNDFIFAVIGEELGLVGTLSIVALFALFVITGWRVARRAPDMLGALIALGATLCIGLQAAINIAVVTQSMPNKGMPLPLISYGGSALVFTMASIGLLLNVAAHPPCDAPPDELGATPRKKTTLGLPSLSTASGE